MHIPCPRLQSVSFRARLNALSKPHDVGASMFANRKIHYSTANAFLLFLPQYPATTHSLTTFGNTRHCPYIHTLFLLFHQCLTPALYHLNLGKPLNPSGTSYATKTLTLPLAIYPVLARRHHHHHLLKTCRCRHHHLQTAPPFLENHLPK